ncbi:hypothetical protein AMTRI_Chr01g109200 [Amborella trichopoda]
MAPTTPRVSFNLRVGDGKRCHIRVDEEEIHQIKSLSDKESTAAVLRNLFDLSVNSGSHISIEVADKEIHPTKQKKQDQNQEAKPEHATGNKAVVPFGSRGPRGFFDITIGDIKAGRIIMELYTDVVPRTAESFRALCTGEKSKAPNGKPLHYKRSSFFSVVPGVFCGGGDCTGVGGMLKDENFKEKHKDFGVLFMANEGKRDNNGSRFAIDLNKNTRYDGHYVVFGGVVEGLHVVRAIENVSSPSSVIIKPVLIADCGEV